MHTLIEVNHAFAAFHRWQEAPKEVSYLREFHRHVFHVALRMGVSHGDREIEFHTLKAKLIRFCRHYDGYRFDLSCEHIAAEILYAFNADCVSVSEDKENGACCIRDRTLPSMQTKKACFFGLECEGPFQGKGTLFVPGSVAADKVHKANTNCFRNESKVEAVYYGAGNDRETNQETFQACLEIAAGRKVPLHVEYSEAISTLPKHYSHERAEQQGMTICVTSSQAPRTVGYKGTYCKYLRNGDFVVEGPAEGQIWRTPIDHSAYTLDVTT